MRLLVYLILLTCVSFDASARSKTYRIYVNEPLKLYYSPSPKSTVVHRFKAGDVLKARLTKKRYYLYVELEEDHSVKGFVYTKQINNSRIKRLKEQRAEGEKEYAEAKTHLYKQKMGIGLRYLHTQMSQQGYQDVVNEVNYEYSEFKSTGSDFGLQVSLASKTHWQWRFAFVSRKTDFRATANAKSINQSNIDVVRQQKLIGLSMHANYYFNKNGSLYGLLGLEAAKGTDLTLKFGAQTLVGDESDLPFFTIGRLGIGVDWHMFGSAYLNPEARVGVDFNSDPLTLVYSLVLGLNWQM